MAQLAQATDENTAAVNHNTPASCHIYHVEYNQNDN